MTYIILTKPYVQVVKMESSMNPLPFEFYHLPFCRPPKITRRIENLGMLWHLTRSCLTRSSGEVLRGDRIMNTNYKVRHNMHVYRATSFSSSNTTSAPIATRSSLTPPSAR